MFCGNPMEDDDLFCTSCGKAIVDDADDSSAKKSADSEMMAEDATITSTRHMRNPNEAAGAGMAAGAAYGAGHAYGPDSPAGMRPESNAYGHAPAGGAGGGEYGRAAAGGAGYGAGRPASNGGGYKTADPGRSPAGSGGKKKSSKSPMYGNPHVDSAIESSRRGRKADASRLIMLATAAVLILILGALLFMLVKPVKSDEDEKEENPVAVLDESGKEDEKLNQGHRKRMKARKLQLPLRPPRRTMRRLSRTAERIPPQRWRSAIQRPRSSRMTTGACRRRRKSLLPRKTAAADGPPMKTAMKSIMPATGKKIRTTIRPVLLPLTTNTFFRTVTSGIIPEKN